MSISNEALQKVMVGQIAPPYIMLTHPTAAARDRTESRLLPTTNRHSQITDRDQNPRDAHAAAHIDRDRLLTPGREMLRGRGQDVSNQSFRYIRLYIAAERAVQVHRHADG